MVRGVFVSISYKLSFIILGLVAAAALAVGATIDRGSRDLIESLEVRKLSRVVELHAAHLDDALQRLRADLETLQHAPLLTRTAAATDAEFEAAWSDPSHRAQVADLFHIFHALQQDDTQVRVIRGDEAGGELVRVDRRGEELVRVPTADLQDEGDSLYVKHGRTLNAGEVWLSPVSLNRERGAITANAMEGEEKRCRAAGCDDYATKPIPREQLKQTVARWVVPDTREQPAQHAA